MRLPVGDAAITRHFGAIRSSALTSAHTRRMQLRTLGTVIAGLVGWLAAQRSADADPLDGLAPSPVAEAFIVAGVGIVMGGPWITSLWILLRHSSRGTRRIGALYAAVSGLVVFGFSRDVLWASIVAAPTVPLLVDRPRLDAASRKVGNVLRRLWRYL
jgi:hypothetical protein